MTSKQANRYEPVGSKDPRGTFSMLRVLVRRHPGKCALSVANLSLAGLLDGIGVAALLPTLQLVLASERTGNTPIDRAFAALFEMTGWPQTVGFMLFLVFAVVALKAVVKLLAMRQVAHAAVYIVADNRMRLIRASMAARWDHFISLSSGKMANAISVEAERAGSLYNAACKLFAESIQAVFYLAVALAISWQVTLSSIVVGGLIILLLYRLVGMTRRAGRTQTYAQTGFTGRLVDGLAGMKPLKSMGGEERLAPLLASDIRLLQRTSARLTLLGYYVRIAQEPFAVGALAIGVYLLLVVWAFPFSALLVLAFLFMRTVGSINSIQRSVQNIASYEAPFWLIEDLTADAVRAAESKAGRQAPAFTEAIEFQDVSFAFGDRVILDRASFTLRAGEFVTITGPSGIGKTTTADLIIGLYRPAAGAILIDGVDLADVDLLAWRGKIGYVPQDTYLFHDTVAVNVTLGEEGISDEAVVAALERAGAWQFVEAMPQGIHSVVGERGGLLSGGQRQRIAIARALVRAPRLLVLDESTTALDTATEASIIASLRELAGEVTILAVSHQPAMVSVADKVLKLDNGKVHPVPEPVAEVAAS